MPAAIIGNFIGTNGPYTPPSGNANPILPGVNAYSTAGSPLGNVLNGISLNNVYGVSIGATTPGSQNVIAGNLGRGIQILADQITQVNPPTEPPPGTPGGNNKIYSNLIGVGTGTSPVQIVNGRALSLGNLSDGVFLLDTQGMIIDGSKGVGPYTTIEGVISNNRGYGIHAVGATNLSSSLLITGNPSEPTRPEPRFKPRQWLIGATTPTACSLIP